MSEYTIENWIIINNRVWGNVFNHPDYDDGTLIQTSAIQTNIENVVVTKNSIYILGVRKS